jgi:hypothetical protein
MPRPKRTPQAPLGETAPPPKPTGKLPQLDERITRLAQKAKRKKRLALDVRERDADRFLTLAERWDEDLVVVLRACALMGLRHYEEWASNGAATSPFEEGAWIAPKPHQRDPSGVRADPIPVQPPFQPIRYDGRPAEVPPLAALARPPQAPPPETYTVDTVENVWEPPGGGVPGLPSGSSERVVKPERQGMPTPQVPRPEHRIPDLVKRGVPPIQPEIEALPSAETAVRFLDVPYEPLPTPPELPPIATQEFGNAEPIDEEPVTLGQPETPEEEPDAEAYL